MTGWNIIFGLEKRSNKFSIIIAFMEEDMRALHHWVVYLGVGARRGSGGMLVDGAPRLRVRAAGRAASAAAQAVRGSTVPLA